MANEWKPIFLEALRQSPNVAGAARVAGVNRALVYRERETDPEFAATWEDAQQEATDNLVGEMYRRAYQGTNKPVFYQGERCGEVREYSDTLAIFLAKAHRPEVYGDRIKQEISGTGLNPQVVVVIPDNGRSDRDPAPGGASE